VVSLTGPCQRCSSRSARSAESTLIGVGEIAHPHPALGQLMDQVQHVPHGAAQPVQGVDHDHIARRANTSTARNPRRSTVAPDLLSR